MVTARNEIPWGAHPARSDQPLSGTPFRQRQRQRQRSEKASWVTRWADLFFAERRLVFGTLWTSRCLQYLDTCRPIVCLCSHPVVTFYVINQAAGCQYHPLGFSRDVLTCGVVSHVHSLQRSLSSAFGPTLFLGGVAHGACRPPRLSFFAPRWHCPVPFRDNPSPLFTVTPAALTVSQWAASWIRGQERRWVSWLCSSCHCSSLRINYFLDVSSYNFVLIHGRVGWGMSS